MDARRSNSLSAEYTEVVGNIRMLTDIRFRLLAFLPVAAAFGALFSDKSSAGAVRLPVSVFGGVVTLAFATYNARNDQLYDALIGRAAALERAMGLPDGAYAHRPGSWLALAGGLWPIEHRFPVALTYGASFALWLDGALSVAASSVLQHVDPVAREALSIVLSALVTWLGATLIARNVERRGRIARLHAKLAVHAAVTAGDKYNDPALLQECAALMWKEAPTPNLRARAEWLTRSTTGTRSNYVMSDAPTLSEAAQIVALLTDFGPQWLQDSYEDRRVDASYRSPDHGLAAWVTAMDRRLTHRLRMRSVVAGQLGEIRAPSNPTRSQEDTVAALLSYYGGDPESVRPTTST